MLALALSSAIAVGVYASSVAEEPASQAGLEQVTEAIASPASFDWQIRTTDHFEIHYYAALAPDLETITTTAELAYDRISSELRYTLPFRVPLVVFKTRSDFGQQAIIPGLGDLIVKGDVSAFTEPKRNRVVILLEPDPDKLLRLVTHELTHAFAFDIIPRLPDATRRPALWIDEGFAEYMTGAWDPENLRQIGEFVAAGNLPRLSSVTGWPASVRPQALGHAAFDFIEAEYGSAAVWQFLVSVRRNIVDGATLAEVYQTAFNRTPEEFDAAFAAYLQQRFPRTGGRG
jgi:hypothetical protein